MELVPKIIMVRFTVPFNRKLVFKRRDKKEYASLKIEEL